jgi:hypothetical protein
MKKIMYAACIMALAVLMSAGSSYAGNGNGGGNKGGQKHNGGQDNSTCTRANNAGISQYILGGTPFVYEGTVVSIGSGLGMVIATAEGNVIVYGIGPVHYWDTLEVDRPSVGDVITASGYTVDYSGVERNVAMSLTIDGTEVQLRDPETAKPLWAGSRKGRK